MLSPSFCSLWTGYALAPLCLLAPLWFGCSSSSDAAPAATGGTATGGAIGTGGAGTGGIATGGAATGGTVAQGGAGGVSHTALHPFPLDQVSVHCARPAGFDHALVRRAYEDWKLATVTSAGASGFLRVKKPDSGTVIGSTVSEGMGYGMLLAVYFADQEVFDQLWRYVAKYLNGNGLMDWEIDPSGNVIGTGAASDGDEDIAWALLMADRQWGAARSASAISRSASA